MLVTAAVLYLVIVGIVMVALAIAASDNTVQADRGFGDDISTMRHGEVMVFSREDAVPEIGQPAGDDVLIAC